MLLTLDISTVQTGYAIGAADRRPRWGVFRPGNLPREHRVNAIKHSILRTVKLMGVKAVVAEAVSVGGWQKKDGKKGGGNFQTALTLAEAHGVIKDAMLEARIPYETVNLSSARARLGIRYDLGIDGQLRKDDIREWLARQGYPTVNADEADAMVIYQAVMLGKVHCKVYKP